MMGHDSAHKPILFMVEDEEDTANLIKMMMEKEGYQVIHAGDGRHAQNQIAALPPPALILLDMPLSAWNPRRTNGNPFNSCRMTGSRSASLIFSQVATRWNWVTQSTALM